MLSSRVSALKAEILPALLEFRNYRWAPPLSDPAHLIMDESLHLQFLSSAGELAALSSNMSEEDLRTSLGKLTGYMFVARRILLNTTWPAERHKMFAKKFAESLSALMGKIGDAEGGVVRRQV